jgi:hypothetical protein
MAFPQAIKQYTVEEYLALERASTLPLSELYSDVPF